MYVSTNISFLKISTYIFVVLSNFKNRLCSLLLWHWLCFTYRALHWNLNLHLLICNTDTFSFIIFNVIHKIIFIVTYLFIRFIYYLGAQNFKPPARKCSMYLGYAISVQPRYQPHTCRVFKIDSTLKKWRKPISCCKNYLEECMGILNHTINSFPLFLWTFGV